MSLWDLIRDFFVMHVFGGHTANTTAYSGFVGVDYINGYDYSVNDLFYKVGLSNDGELSAYLSLGDWLSTTATAISITIIVVLCCLFVYKIIKLIGGLIR